MPTIFSEVFARVWQLVADFRANEKLQVFYTNRCDRLLRYGVLRSLDRLIDVLVYDLYALTPDEIKTVEGAAKSI